jgi:hypothetical protein
MTIPPNYRRYVLVQRYSLTAFVIVVICFAVASVQAQDANSRGKDESKLGDLPDSELSLRDLMLEEFEKEAKAGADGEEDSMELQDGSQDEKKDSSKASKDQDEDETDSDQSTSDKEKSSDSNPSPKAKRSSSSAGAVSRLQRPLSEISLAAISQRGTADGSEANRNQRPTNAAAELMHFAEPGWVTSAGATLPTYSRQTIRFCHRPLYFEDPNLERCGNGLGCLQNPVSAVRFLGDALTLPCQMIRQCPCRQVSSTGDCRCNQSLSN